MKSFSYLIRASQTGDRGMRYQYQWIEITPTLSKSSRLCKFNSYRPTEETRNRKRLRPNQLAEWELRIGRLRVFCDVDAQANRVKIEAVGYKQGNRLLIYGKKYIL